ncbi:sugar phosphate nucleotidyltransferase [Paenibacillus marinisediminis]
MKGLILCAGKGTRLQPFSNDISKALLPVANKPLIHYSIEKLIALNIKDIGIVIQSAQEAMFRHCVGDGTIWEADITYLYQERPLGIADAVKRAEVFIGSDSFMLLLGDNMIEQSLAGLQNSILQKRCDGALLLGEVVKPQDYGIAEIANQRIIGLEEKPSHPKSNLAILGAYAFTPHIFDAIHAISPSRRGEYEITDAIQWLIDRQFSIAYDVTKLSHTDVGTIERWLEATRWVLQSYSAQELEDSYEHVQHCTVIQPVMIHPSSQVSDSVIGPYTVIGPNVTLERCQVKGSIILDGVTLCQREITDAVVNEHHAVTIARGADV